MGGKRLGYSFQHFDSDLLHGQHQKLEKPWKALFHIYLKYNTRIIQTPTSLDCWHGMNFCVVLIPLAQGRWPCHYWLTATVNRLNLNVLSCGCFRPLLFPLKILTKRYIHWIFFMSLVFRSDVSGEYDILKLIYWTIIPRVLVRQSTNYTHDGDSFVTILSNKHFLNHCFLWTTKTYC